MGMPNSLGKFALGCLFGGGYQKKLRGSKIRRIFDLEGRGGGGDGVEREPRGVAEHRTLGREMLPM